MNIFVTGATGLVGSKLLPLLMARGHTVRRVTRTPRKETDVDWSPGEGEINAEAFSEADAVVHLAGESIAEGRWTEAKKKRIRESRVDATQKLCDGLAGLDKRPQVLVSASAIGYYGDRGEERLTEQSPPGDLFLSDVCRGWESATQSAARAGMRVVNLRIGMVLSSEGGALKKMLLPFKLGLGGKVGSGKQYWSWISIDDLAHVISHCLDNDSLQGPVNAVSPQPVTSSEFTKTLGAVLHRPTLIPIPAFGARIAFGEMGDELLLASAQVFPTRLEASGYSFKHPDLKAALESML